MIEKIYDKDGNVVKKYRWLNQSMYILDDDTKLKCCQCGKQGLIFDIDYQAAFCSLDCYHDFEENFRTVKSYTMTIDL